MEPEHSREIKNTHTKLAQGAEICAYQPINEFWALFTKEERTSKSSNEPVKIQMKAL